MRLFDAHFSRDDYRPPVRLAATMTKCVEFDWRVPVPAGLQDGMVADKWVEEKDSADLEHDVLFK